MIEAYLRALSKVQPFQTLWSDEEAYYKAAKVSDFFLRFQVAVQNPWWQNWRFWCQKNALNDCVV